MSRFALIEPSRQLRVERRSLAQQNKYFIAPPAAAKFSKFAPASPQNFLCSRLCPNMPSAAIERYNHSAIALHWLLALMIITSLCVGIGIDILECLEDRLRICPLDSVIKVSVWGHVLLVVELQRSKSRQILDESMQIQVAATRSK